MAHLFKRAFSTLKTLRRAHAMNSADLPDVFMPPVNKSMKELDRSFFKKVVPTSVAALSQPRKISDVRATLLRTQELLQISGVRPVVDDPTQPGLKCIIMRPEVKVDRPEMWSQELSRLVDDGVVQVKPYELSLTYENWNMHNILEAVLPDLPEDQKETPGGFAMAGHIAHMNLRDQYLPYKNMIGQILLDKNPTVRTVINKTMDVGSESVFRTFPYEVLAGVNDLVTTVSEQGCVFRFNFAEVYWNSRLGTEHERLVAKFNAGEAVCDVMAGVGPFTIPAGKKGVFVRANDLNPHSFEGLKWAIQRNKVQQLVSASCSDGREFIRQESKTLRDKPRSWTKKWTTTKESDPSGTPEDAGQKQEHSCTFREPESFDHFVMNLPATAIEFLDAFRGLYHTREHEFAPFTDKKLPMVHVYTFQSKMDTPEEEAQKVCEAVSHHLGHPVSATHEDTEISYVRLVSPTKRMYRASFRLPSATAFTDP